MTSEVLQVLVAFAPGRDASVLEQLRHGPQVTALQPPRLATVRINPKEVTALQNLDGVQAVFVSDVPSLFLETLSPQERLFTLAWQSHGRMKKERPGEGRSWDAPGFEPPDRPKGRNRS